jgi:hypothetical protein
MTVSTVAQRKSETHVARVSYLYLVDWHMRVADSAFGQSLDAAKQSSKEQ